MTLTPIAILSWLYGVIDPVRPVDDTWLQARVSARTATQSCPASLRAQIEGNFAENGLLDATAEALVQLTDAGLVAAVSIEIPAGANTQNSAAHVELKLSDFDAPVDIRPPDAGEPVTLREYLGRQT